MVGAAIAVSAEAGCNHSAWVEHRHCRYKSTFFAKKIWQPLGGVRELETVIGKSATHKTVTSAIPHQDSSSCEFGKIRCILCIIIQSCVS
jgi:hypothetical protein